MGGWGGGKGVVRGGEIGLVGGASPGRRRRQKGGETATGEKCRQCRRGSTDGAGRRRRTLAARPSPTPLGPSPTSHHTAQPPHDGHYDSIDSTDHSNEIQTG